LKEKYTFFLYFISSVNTQNNCARKLLDRSSLNVLCMLPVWPSLGPPLSALRYVAYFRFCGWRHVFTEALWCVMCKRRYNAVNTTARIPTKFCSPLKTNKYILSVSCVLGGGVKCVIYDCVITLKLH